MYTTTQETEGLYVASATLGENRRRYFEANGFGDGGYDAKWVTLKQLGPLRLGFPNSPGRVRAVRLHDLHHVLSGYGTNWTGEAEIAAFELGAGCGRHYAAWVLNGGALLYGVWIAPVAVFRAFVRGRRALSLYAERPEAGPLFDGEFHEALLDESTGELRSALGLGATPTATATDVLAFAGFLAAGVAVVSSPWLLLAAAVHTLFV